MPGACGAIGSGLLLSATPPARTGDLDRLSIAAMTLSGTPACFSAMRPFVDESYEPGDAPIFATIVSGPRPTFTSEMIVSLLSNSEPDRAAAGADGDGAAVCAPVVGWVATACPCITFDC